MKDIIIIGCPRSGKTTLANMLQKRLNYRIISLDSIVSAFEQNFPEIGISRKEVFREKSKKIVPFISTYIKKYKEDYPNHNFVIEGCQMMPYHIFQQFNKSEILCICLGYPNAYSNDILNNIRKGDEYIKNSYSKKLLDEDLRKRIEFWIELSKFLQEESKQYGIPFYETDINREIKLFDILNTILNNLVEKDEKEERI